MPVPDLLALGTNFEYPLRYVLYRMILANDKREREHGLAHSEYRSGAIRCQLPARTSEYEAWFQGVGRDRVDCAKQLYVSARLSLSFLFRLLDCGILYLTRLRGIIS